MTMNSKLKSTIIDAIKYANTYAEAATGFEKEAFQVALQHYLRMEHDRNMEAPPASSKKLTEQDKNDEKNLEMILHSYEWSSTKIPKLQSIDQYLHLLQIAKNELQIDKLSANEIKIILHEKFRINKTANNISMALMIKVGNYVDRVKTGSAYKYKITINGEKYLNEIMSGD